MSNDATKPRVVTKTVHKPVESGPEENLKAILKKTDVTYIRFFLGGPEGELPTEFIYHRPIGCTKLDGDEDWVRSSPQDVALLLARKASPNLKALLVLRNQHMKEAAVVKGLIKLDTDGITVQYPDGTDRNNFLKPFREKAEEDSKLANKAINEWKKADKKSRSPNPPEKVNKSKHISEALAASGNPLAKREIAFAGHMSDKAIIEAAEEAFPDDYETMKGPSADIPQRALVWAKKLSKQELQIEMVKFFTILSGRKPSDLGPKISAALSIHNK
jgi:hypothetical protein